MREKSHKYDITQCALYKKKSSKQLKKVLCITEEEYKDILSIVHYHSFQIDKKDSTEKRNITAPDKRIKEIQTRILKLLQNVERPIWLISGEKGKCYIDNGKSHLNSNYFLTMDIKKFYDNCFREYVFLFFKNRLMMAGDLAGLCTDIVTYDGGIPTGCPTSQIIAYYAYESMFNEIYSVACKYGCEYTVYVDDMTFSAKEPFDINRMKNEVDCILRKYGHKPKYKKVKYYSKGKSVPITGTIVTGQHTLLQEGEYTKEEKLFKKKTDTFSGVYWCLTTAIYLAWSFWTMSWDITWIVWPVAGVLFAALLGVVKMVLKNGSETQHYI